MFHTALLRAFGHYGKIDPPVFSFNFGGTKVLSSAQARGGFRGLKHYSEENVPPVKASRSGRLNFHDNPGDLNHSEVGLAFKLWFPSTYNTPSAWSALTGGTGYLEQPYNPFPGSRGDTPGGLPAGSVPGLAHTREEANQASGYQGYSIPANYPWSIRLALFEKPDNQDFDLFQLRWAGYQINWQNGGCGGGTDIMRLAPDLTNPNGSITTGWNQTQEDALNTLLAVADPTSTQMDSIETKRAAIYRDFGSLSLGDDAHDAAYKRYTLTFIPVGTGRLLVVNGRGQVKVVNQTDILMTRQPGTLWPSCNVQLRRNGGAYTWQVGYPVFNPTGYLYLDPYDCGYFASSLGALQQYLSQWLPPGTNITLTNNLNGTTGQIVLNFSTTNTRLSPFFYWGFAYTQGGDRTGSTTEVFPNGDSTDPAGDPIMEVTPSYETDNHTSALIKQQVEVVARDINGLTFQGLPSNFHYEALENRTATLVVDNDNIVTDGIVKEVIREEMADATENQIPAHVTKAATQARLIICGQDAILEELYTNGEIGDNRYLGFYLRAMLKNCGVPVSKLAGISATAGRLLPQGVSSEEPCVRPGEHMKYADWIRDVLLKWGMGWYLYCHPQSGIWTFEKRPTSVQSLYGSPLHFVTRNYPYSADSYPGRFTILDQYDAPRDATDFYNLIVVLGGEDAQGHRIIKWWINDDSIALSGGNPPGKDFLGRVRKLVIDDSGLRTDADVDYVLRSARMQYGIPPRFHKFKSFFHPLLTPQTGSFITVGGLATLSGGVESLNLTNAINCRVEAITGVSYSQDECIILARELI